MKKAILFALMLASSSALMSQTYITGGVNATNISIDDNGKTEDNNTLISFNAGFFHQFDLSKVVDLQAGLLLTGKGAKAETNFSGSDYIKASFNPFYLEVPVNVIVKITDTKKNGIFFHAGPYVAAGIGGNSKTETRIGLIQSNSKSKIEFNDDDPLTSQQEGASYDKLKRFDYGINAGIGIGGEKTMLRLNYGLGLAKINSTQTNNSDNEKNKYRVLSLNLAFKL